MNNVIEIKLGDKIFEINKAVFFGKTVYQVFFENINDPQPFGGLLGNYDTLAAAKKAVQSAII